MSELKDAAEAVLEEMINDLILSTAMSAHREIKRGRAICGTCGTRCRAHLPLHSSSSSTLNVQGSSSGGRSISPNPNFNGNGNGESSNNKDRSSGYLVGPEKGTGGSTGIGSGSGRSDNGNVYFDCLVCSRAIVSNRYAPHLASCLGLNGSTRRGAARSAAAKARLGTNDRSSPSPYVQSNAGGSDNGDYYSDGDSVSGSKKKKILNGNGKRGPSPGKPPIGKKTKLGSTSNSGSATPTLPQRQALPPSKLGRPPTKPVPSSPDSPIPISAPGPAYVPRNGGGGGGGMTGAKTLPGLANNQHQGFGMGATEVIDPGDESSEGVNDDY